MVVAMIPRGSKDSAEDLQAMHTCIMSLLRHADLHPVSHSADGTDVERSAQHLIELSATSVSHYVFKAPVPACEPISVNIYYYDNHPFVMLQDSNHARKTGRNQLCTGARAIVIGQSLCHFAQLFELAHHYLTPLLTHDVVKVDKQDDRAAARTTSAPNLRHILISFPEYNGLAIYIFVVGDMVDAYQNRSISHVERATMVLTARYFLMAWRSHTEMHPDHSLSTHFISRESFEIFLMVCDGLLALIVLYRKEFPTFPLLPWLHSTEACEHIFGTLRTLKADFTAMDALYIQPKLRTLLLAAFDDILHENPASDKAAGYFHSYHLSQDIDFAVLSRWPSDEELQSANQRGFEAASQLLSAVGIDAAAMLAKYRPPQSSPKAAKTSAIARPRPPQTLNDLIALYDYPGRVPSSTDDVIEVYETAIVAAGIDLSMKMYVFSTWSGVHIT